MNTADSMQLVTLQPGEFHFGDANTRIQTLLGSCVAITLWHPIRRIGGMCHYMLPSRHTSTHELDGRYAEEAMQMFLRQAARHGTLPQEYQVKLFGGGNMFPAFSKPSAQGSVAENNIAAARRLVARHQLHLVAESLGHTGHRQVLFDIATGDVWVRHHRLTGS